MKPALTIAELAQVATFGANKLKKAALENIQASAIVGYELIKGGNVLRIEVQAPNPVNPETSLRRFQELEKNEANKAFFADIENGTYLSYGELRVDAFVEAFMPLFEAKITTAFGYGSEPELKQVIHNGKGEATVVFTSIKNEKRVDHNARWELLDIAEDFNKTVLIPRNLYKSYNEFLNLFADAIGQPRSRFFLKDDPMEVKGDGIEVYVNGNDLVYYGKLTVALPWSGTEVNVIDNEHVPTEEEETDPVGGDEGTGEPGKEPEPETPPPPAANLMSLTKEGSTLTYNFDRAVTLGGAPLEAYSKSAIDFIKETAVPFKDLELFDMALVADNIALALTANSATLTLNPGFFDKEVFTMLDDAKVEGADQFAGNADGIYRVDFNINAGAFASVDGGAITAPADVAVKITVFTDVSKTVTEHTPEDYAAATILGVFGDTPVYPA